MSRYHEQTHSHKGLSDDGSRQISYNDLLDKPNIGGVLTSVAHDETLTGDGTSGDPLSVAIPYIAPTLGSEVNEYSYTGSATQITTLKVTAPLTTHQNAQAALVKITAKGVSGRVVTTTMSPSITGAESYDSDWVTIIPTIGGAATVEKSVVLLLPFGLYRVNFAIAGGANNVTVSIKYKIVDTKIAY